MKMAGEYRSRVDGPNDHCQLDDHARGSKIMFDWLDEVFATCYEAENDYEMV